VTINESSFSLQEIKIEVTNKCPLVCIHCSSDSTPNNIIEIKENKCLSILKEAKELGVEEVAFSGGEPLVYPYIENVVEYAVNSGMKVILYTTGNVDAVKDRLIFLKSNELSKIIFSLYAANEKINDFITRTAGSFNKTIHAIKESVLIGLDVEIHFVALSRNYKELKQIVELSSELRISKISILRFVPQGRGSLLQNDIMNKLQYFELKKMIENLIEKGYQIRTGSPLNFLWINNNPVCFAGINRLIIAPDLRIYPCDAFKQILAEDIVKSNSYSTLDCYNLRDCWEKSPYLNVVRKYLCSDAEEPCKSCNNYKKCISGCLAQKVIKYGGLVKKPDPSCLLS